MHKVGEKINNVTLLEKQGRGTHKDAMWKCKCECGNIFYRVTPSLTNIKDCGCSRKRKRDLTGKRFDRLKVISKTDRRDKCGNIIYECLCDCGNITYVSSTNLKSAGHKTYSCGCKKRDNSLVHGLSQSKIYNVYLAMKQRCNNPKNINYKNYGGRNIHICDEWLNDFINFYSWAIHNGYSENLSIDRIDVNKGYNPDNCRWIPMREQANNRRQSHYLEYDGKKMTVRDWAKTCNMKYYTFYNKVVKGKHSIGEYINK